MSTQQGDSGLPPVHQRQPVRISLATRLLVSLDGRLRAFAREHRTTIQAVIEEALDEYMKRRGG